MTRFVTVPTSTIRQVHEGYHTYDDFDDNALSDRSIVMGVISNSAKWCDGGAKLTIPLSIKGAVKLLERPDWDIVSGSPSVTSGELVLPDGLTTYQSVYTPCTKFEGTYEFDVKWTNVPTSDSVRLYWCIGTDYRYQLYYGADGIFGLYDNVDATYLIQATVAIDTEVHTIKATRDANGNWEIFFDGVSQGTVTDTTTTSIDHIMFENRANAEVHIDNVRVY